MLPPKFTSRGAAGSAAHAAPRRARFPQMASPTADLAHCGGTLIRHAQCLVTYIRQEQLAG